MAFLEYQLADYRKHFQIRETDSEPHWLFKHAKKTASRTPLEEEIHSLRRMLEQMVVEGKEMTSDAVVELSTILDKKINEYMNKGKKSR
ncbi:aspartyl-phosphate phosphatase Spo0E family protein [Paenibacillus athensensis]|uniref:Spo0E like sporulation regulatory protein n=1 Tax=Paenibacillus athensensis TaxID=1967502 RepID=A0A4Y8PRW0_9BACL|nr:aspartyl-phosphate phosphatase Spo0E family protein [Paenibacillus athensensis]MCD1262018.1 aspartyl-phosphate phosphatase Spo0E family protein [Paenibacillus athensensis]